MDFKISTIWHLLFLLYHICCMIFCINLFFRNDDPFLEEIRYFGPFYLSIWCTLLQIFYINLSLLSNNADHFPKKIRNLKHKLKSLKGYMFITFVLPLTTYVTAVFWTIFFLNKEFVPSTTFERIPSWINHGYHTFGMILVLMDLFFENNSIPPIRSAFFGITVLAIVYYSIYVGIYFLFGKWLYIFFYQMTWLQIVIAFVVAYLLHLGLVATGVKVHHLLRSRIKQN